MAGMSVLHGVLDQTSRHPGEFDVFGLTDPPQQVKPRRRTRGEQLRRAGKQSEASTKPLCSGQLQLTETLGGQPQVTGSRL